MEKHVTVVIYVVALVAVIVCVDLLFFRHEFWPRLMANVGIVLVFAAFGVRFLRRAQGGEGLSELSDPVGV